MADKQYDVSHKLQRLFEEKQKIRQALRQKLLALEYSPYRRGAQLIDPAVIRYHAMLTYRPEYMYATPKNTSLFCCCILFPVIFTYFSIVYESKNREKIFRTGQVAYKDRQYCPSL